VLGVGFWGRFPVILSEVEGPLAVRQPSFVRP
jgi:hypothetical protein